MSILFVIWLFLLVLAIIIRLLDAGCTKIYTYTCDTFKPTTQPPPKK